MPPDIDLTRGGYGGEVVEELYKPITSDHLEYWWQFREVLRASHLPHSRWKRIDGNPLTDPEKEELVALSLTNYAVMAGITEALSFKDQISTALTAEYADQDLRKFDIRKNWKALYSSLYSAVVATSNIIRIVCKQEAAVTPRNWNLGQAKNYANAHEAQFVQPLSDCEQRLEIRSHLDHYWTIWTKVKKGSFLFDSNFSKGYVPIDRTSMNYQVDGLQRANDDILACIDNINAIYKPIATVGGYLDDYLQQRQLAVDYTDFGFPHNGQRPRP